MTSTLAGIAHQPRGQTTIQYLPLEEVRVKAWVVDVSSRIVLTQTFYNPSDEFTGRAKYVFPLPANSAVCAFELELEDGPVIIGEVKETEEASLSFVRATEEGKVAALVERVTDDIFKISVGSIPPTTRVVAQLTFVMDLLNEGLRDQVRLQLPMHITERYGMPPAGMQDTSAAGSRTRVHINVDIQTSDVIYDVRSHTHPIVLRYYKGRSNIKSQRRISASWKSPEFLISDFVITIHAEGLDKPRCFAEVLDPKRDGDGTGSTIAMQLTLIPKFQAPKIPSQEYIFIIDRSGSMGGNAIETAKRTLIMLLRLLPSTQTTFNIFSFGSIVKHLWDRSRGLDEVSLTEATSHVAAMGADLGGTEIPNALLSSFNSRALDRPAVVFLLTDGQIYESDKLDPMSIISNAIRVSPNQAPLRLFVVGIGTGVSSDVCSRLARQGNGEYLFALSAEQICGKCARLLNAGRSKNIERIDIDWGYDTANAGTYSSPSTINLPPGIPALAPPPHIQQAPHSLTRIFSGLRFTVFAIMSSRTIPTSVKLITKLEGVSEPQELLLRVTKVKPFRDTNEDSIVPIIHALGARKLIEELEGPDGLLPSPAPGDALLASGDDLRKAGVIRLGLTYQLATKYTSFVAIQRGDETKREKGSRRGGSLAWARSRVRPAKLDTKTNNTTGDTTFLDGVVSGVSSFITSFLGLFGGPTVSANTTSTASRIQRPRFPGAFDGSDSSASERSRSRGRRHVPAPFRGRSSSSHSSIDTISTLSSLEGSSSCSTCWTSSRPSTPPPQSHDPINRVPSPNFIQEPTAPSQVDLVTRVSTHSRVPIRQGVYDLFQQMGIDGSFTSSPLLTQLVGDAILGKADELGVDRRVWATVVVTAYMKIHLEGEPDLLELLSEKAREFVEAVPGVERNFDWMVREAVALLNPQTC